MSVKWKPKCTLCGSMGCLSTNTNGNYPGHSPTMSGRCPKNPTGGNFGHKPRWVKNLNVITTSYETTCGTSLGKS